MNRNMLVGIGVAVVLGLGFWLPGLLERRAQVVKVFETIESLAPGKEAPATSVMRDHLLLAAQQEIERMEQLSPGFSESPVGKNLLDALRMMQPKLGEQEMVSDKENYLRFSEITFDHPTEEDWNRYQKLKAAGTEKEENFLYLLQPRVATSQIRAAYRVRAAGLLRNAQILAGRTTGEPYVTPEPRQEHMWLDSLPVVHPARGR